MTAASNTEERQARPGAEARLQAWMRLAMVFVWAGASNCGPHEPEVEAPRLNTHHPALSSFNGLSANGLSANGLSANGLSANGLSANGLSTEAFAGWFSTDPELSDMVMTYVVRCAVPAGQTRAFTYPPTGKTYKWAGGLGLAPAWAGGAPASLAEQQTITSCMLAHVNRYGEHVTISVLGRAADGDPIPYSVVELAQFNVREACFFGNLFNGEGLYFGIDKTVFDEASYLTRACGELEGGGETGPLCEPLKFIGSCRQRCSGDLLAPFYNQCTYNGVSYRPLSTRMRQSDYLHLFPNWLD
ncbi:GLTT repeat-containing protein [Stigmatella aurantiaca]|uniref:GLTT repeat-containing protein n=2 Tax=Stigmatella aurantiaca TaxID=41 RepID=A0A1H7NAF2_STIAU|nr:GLTT repeat-containing protein [Stigmatella aurantiaca]